MINKHNNISSQDALFNNVSIRDTLKSDSIEANEIIKSANPGSTGRIILNGTLTVLGNDNSIDTIKNVNITNNELQFTNESGTTTANKITQENGITNITGGNITFNHTLKVTGDNNNVTTISDANIANNKEIEFINENGNTTIDNITGESTITNGNISFNNVVTVKNEQDNQNNITSITSSNITNNKEINFTNQTANSLIDNITGESSISSGNISFDNIVTVKNQQDNQNNITSITDSNINNNNSMSFTNQTANTTIDNITGESTITGGNITSNNVVTVKNEQNDNNNITSITNSNITNNNEIKLTNPTANTTIDTLQNGEGNLTITGGNITSNNIITVKNEQNDNNNITSITDSNLTNNNSLTFTKQTANTAIDNLQTGDGDLTITGGNISFDNVVTIKNQQDNQNNITSITNSNINNNNSMSFTNETANTTIDTLQKGEGDLTITGGNINTNNIITVTDQSVITSLTNANITNSGTITLNNASIDQLITSTINGPKTLNDSLKETKFKYKEETLKKSTDTVTGTKYYNIPYVKVLNNVTYYGELVNKTEELNTSHVNYDMKYYYADIIYYQYQNKIIIPENQSVNVNKADQISLVNADVTNNGTLNISDGSVIQEIIGDVKFSGKVNLEAVTEIRDVDNIILEEAIITNNKGINITGESTISSIIDSNIGGNVTIDTKGHVTVNNVVNSTITDGTVTINDNITSTVTNSNLVGGTVNFGENKTLTVDVKAGTLENEIIKTITDSTINNAKVTLNNNITSTVTNSDLNATTIDLNNNTLTANNGSTVNNINNSTITNGNVSVSNDLTSSLADVTLNNIGNVNLNDHSLTANSSSSVSNINNSTITNGNVSVSNDLTSSLANVTLNNIADVDLNSTTLTAKNESTVSNINNSTITNGNVSINNSLNTSLANVVLGDNVNNDVKVNLNSNTLTANNDSSISKINKSTITNGTVTINDSLNTSLANVVLGDNVNNDVKVNLNSNTLTAETGSSISDIKKSTITNGTVTINENLSSSLTSVVLLSDIENDKVVKVDLNTKSLNAKTGSSINEINKSTITNGTVTINENLSSSLIGVTLKDNVTVDLNNTNSLTANNGSSVSNINNSTITNGDVLVNNSLTSSLANVTLNNIANVNLNNNSLTTEIGTNSTISNINNSTITNGNVSVNNSLTSSLADVTLNNIANVDLNNNSLTTTTGTGINSTVSKIDNSTITNGNVTINNDLDSLLKNVVLDNISNVNLSGKSLNAKTVSSISEINNSTLTNGTLTINNDITSQVTNSNIENGTVDLNNHKLTANGDITLINITGGVITNTGTLEANGTITANQINSNLLKDQTGTNQIMAYDKDNKKITFCNHTTLTCSGTEDTLTTDNLVIDRITLNEVREVDGGIVTTGLKVGFPYWTDLGTTEQGTTINIEGNILHVVKVLVDGVNHYQLWISIMDIEFSLKSTKTKIITKGTTFEGSVLINSLDDLTLGENEHLYIQSANVPIANGKMLNGMVINASIDNNGVITGKSLQTNQISNENGDKSIIKYESGSAGINPKITIGAENVDLEIIGFDQKNINCDTLTASNYVKSDLLQSKDGKQIIKYEPAGTGTNPKITLGAENVDLEIVGFDQKNIVCETLTATNRIKTDLIYSSNNNTPLIQLNDSTVTVERQDKITSIYNLNVTHHLNVANNLTVTNDLTVDNNIYSDKIYSKTITTQPIFIYDSTNTTLSLGNSDTKTKITRLCTNTIADYLNNYVLFSYNDNYLELGNADSNYLYTLIHKIKTTEPLYISSLNYWDESINSISLINYDPVTKTLTIGDSLIPTTQKTNKLTITNDLTVDNGFYTNNIYSNETTTKPLLIYDLSNTVTIGSSNTTTKTNDLTITNNLKIGNITYTNNIYSNETTAKPLFSYDSSNTILTVGNDSVNTRINKLRTNTIADYLNNYVLFSYNDNYLELGNADSNYLYTLIHKIRTDDPLYISSLKYWVSSTDSISLINYDPLTKTITIGDSTKSTKQKTDNLTVTTDLNTANLTVTNNIYVDNIYSHTNTAKPIVRYDTTSGNMPGVMLGNESGRNTIYNSIVLSLYPHNNPTYQIFGELQDSNVTNSDYTVNPLHNYIFFGNSGFAYTLIHKLRTNDPLYAPSIYYWPLNSSKTSAIPLLVYNDSTITLGNDSTTQKTHNLTVTNSLTSSNQFYSNKMTSTNNVPLLNYESSNNTITLGNDTANISIPGTLSSLKTDLIKDSANNSIISVDAGTITIGSASTTQKTNNLTVDNGIYTNNIYSNTTDKYPLLKYENSSTKKITLGSASTTQETHNLTVTNSLTSSNQFYSNKMTSLTSSISLLNFSNNYLEVGSSADSYNRTLVRKFRSNEPIGVPSIYYWSSSDNTLSIPLLNYTTDTKIITLGNNTTNISIPNRLLTNTIADYSGTYNLLSYTTSGSTKKITIGSSSTTQETDNLSVVKNIYTDSIYSYNHQNYALLRTSSSYGAILGNYNTGNERNFIYKSIVIGLYGHYNSDRQVFGEATDNKVSTSSYNYVFLGHPNYAYTLIHNLRTNEPLYTPSIYYWPTDTAKTSAIPLLVYDNTNQTITLGNTTTNISIPGTITSLKTNSIKDSENDSIISVDTKQDTITIGNDYKQTIIKNADYSDIFNKIYVSMGQNIKFKIESNPMGIDDVIKTVTLTTVTVTTSTGQSATYENINAYQNADSIYNQYTTGQIFMATNTVTNLNEVYIIPKKRNLFSKPGDTGPFNTKQTARMCFVFCNLYFIIKTPTKNDETSSGLWTSSNGNVWYEFSPKDFNNQTGPYSEATVTGAKFDISLTETINSLSIGYIPRGWMTGYEEYEDHYVLGFPLSVTSYYAAFLLYDYDEYMTREVTYDGGCTIL